MMIITALVVSLFVAFSSDYIGLPGDSRLPISSSVSRGALSAFLLTLLFSHYLSMSEICHPQPMRIRKN